MSERRLYRKTLLTLHEVIVSLEGGRQVGPVSWSIVHPQRLALHCARPEQWEALVAVLTGQLTAEQGALEELNPVVVQTDARLRESLDLNQSVQDFLHSPDAPEFVWLEGRRRVLWVLVDLLGIAPHMMRRPLRMEQPAVLEKYWALRFLVSRAELLIGKGVFELDDPQVRSALRLRWRDFPGVVLAGARREALPGPVDALAIVDEQGRFRLETGTGSPLPGSREERGP